MYIPLLRSLSSSNAGMTSSANSASAASSPSSTSSSSSSSSDTTGGLDTEFLQLLSAQLQAQSPIDPLDPNQFVAQLAQFQSLSELTQIDQSMLTLVSDLTPASGASANGQSAVIPHSSSLPSINITTH
ncbi:MAG: flagellar hook capping FlgD N-terminal domain-containing protein [Terriglobales bacterium]